MFACAIATLSMLLVACGGDDDSGQRVLRFTGRDETEANFRGRIRQIVGENPIGISVICTQVRGLSPKEAAAELARDASDDDGEVPKGTTPKPGQKGDAKDLERAAEIFQQECTRMFPK